jgi:hypothetical protein
MGIWGYPDPEASFAPAYGASNPAMQSQQE